MSDEHRKELTELRRKAYSELELESRGFGLAITLAPLATADAALPPFMEARLSPTVPPDNPNYDEAVQNAISELSGFLAKLHHAGRKDL